DPNNPPGRGNQASDPLQPLSQPASLGTCGRCGPAGERPHRKGVRGTLFLGHRNLCASVSHLYLSPDCQKSADLSLQDAAAGTSSCQRAGPSWATFPWRTISGEEASAYYAAGTAQYHLNADIMYALRKYVQATGDEQFLRECGSSKPRGYGSTWVSTRTQKGGNSASMGSPGRMNTTRS